MAHAGDVPPGGGPRAQPGRIALLSTDLMAEAVSDGASVSKTACLLAAALEEAFIQADWPSGSAFALRSDICRRYGASERVFLEAVRVLTTRGTARLVRGADPALEILKPDRELLLDMLSGHSFLSHATESDRRRTLDLLDNVAVRTRGLESGAVDSALDFFRVGLNRDSGPGPPSRSSTGDRLKKTRAGRIANYFIEQYWRAQFVPGQRILSLQDISDAYAADRSIARQAVRLLESSGLFSSLPGRGNGVVVTKPLPGPVCRALCCYYSSVHMPIAEALEFFNAISIEAVMLCARSSNADDVARACRAVTEWGDGPRHLRGIIAIENSIFAAMANPLIDLLLRSVRGYITLQMDALPETLRSDMAERFFDATLQTIDAIARGDVAAAGRLHAQKLVAMRGLAA